MLTKENLWKFQILAERMWRLALDFASEGAAIQHFGQGMLIVADETRYLADKLYTHYEDMLNSNNNIDQSDLMNTIHQVRLLAVNSVLEVLKTNEATNNVNPQLPILFEALMNVTNDLIDIVGIERTVECEQREVIERNTVTENSIYVMNIVVGPYVFIENINYVREVVRFNKDHGEEVFDEYGNLVVRGESIPIIDCYAKLHCSNQGPSSDTRQIAIIVNTNWDQEHNTFAVLVDDVVRWSVFKTTMGKSTHCLDDGLKDYTRECWKSTNDKQFLFMNWNKLK